MMDLSDKNDVTYDKHNEHQHWLLLQVAPLRLLLPLNKRRQDLNFMGSSSSLIIIIIIIWSYSSYDDDFDNR